MVIVVVVVVVVDVVVAVCLHRPLQLFIRRPRRRRRRGRRQLDSFGSCSRVTGAPPREAARQMGELTEPESSNNTEAFRWILGEPLDQLKQRAHKQDTHIHTNINTHIHTFEPTTRAAELTKRKKQQQQQHQHSNSKAMNRLEVITREHIDHLRKKFESLPSKTPADQEISLEFSEHQIEVPAHQQHQPGRASTRVVQLAQLTIKSGAKNALSGKMISELTERLDELELWCSGGVGGDGTSQGDHSQSQSQSHSRSQSYCLSVARCLLIRGHNGTFCAGSDLITVRATTTQLAGWELAQLMQYNLRRLQELPLVSVAFIEGYALGGGAELALSADMRLMSDSAKLGFVHAKNGICCGWSGGLRLVQLAGRARATELLSSGRPIQLEEAQRVGLCEARANNLEEATKFALEHAIESGLTSGAVKRLLQAASQLPAELALQVECQLFASTWGKAAHLRALENNIKHNR